jgi:protein-S-isoprenylcysteine O-methyltransferase Ste14
MRHVAYDVSRVGTWICWGAFLAVWIAGAAVARQRGPAEDSSGRDAGSRAGVILACGILVSPASWWRPLTIGAPWLRLGGLVLLALATAGAIWARLALGAMWASRARTSKQHELRTTGPYGITRHPIYTAILAMVAASALAQGLGRWAGLAAAVALVVAVKIRDEERLLSREFPNEYERYRARVPRLIPGLRR